MLVSEVIFWQLEHHRTEDQQLLDDMIMNVPGKVFDLVSMSGDDPGLWSIFCISRSELGQVEDFPIIERSRADLANTEWRIAKVVAVFEISAVFDLLIVRRVEEGFTNDVLAVDLVLGQTEVGDVEEACGMPGKFCSC